MTEAGSSTELDRLVEGWCAAGLVQRTGWTGAPLLSTPLPTAQPGRPGYVPGVWFDSDAVLRVLSFFRLLFQLSGRWRGAQFVLLDWQVRWLIAPVFGWRNPDGSRVIRTVWFEIPRKNGKSTLCSGLALYLWSADREPGAQVYAAAGDRKQAGIVFGAAREMAMTSRALTGRARLLRSVLEYPPTGSVFRSLSSDGGLQHGLNVHGAIIDEVHVHRRRGVIDALETGTGSRVQPLVVFITTADDGEDEFSIYVEKRTYAENVAGGNVTDPTFWGVVFAAEETADPFAPATWEAANPGIGWTVRREYLEKESGRAAATPGYLNEFLRLHLNRRTRAATTWLDLARWDRQAGVVDPQALRGRACFGGLDLSSTTDTTALTLWFPPDGGRPGQVLPYFWLPEERLPALTRLARVPFDRWAKQGWLRTTEGDVVDYRQVRKVVEQAKRDYQLVEVGYDPYNAVETTQELTDAGVTMVPIRQGYLSLSPPAKELERLVLAGQVEHGGHPVLRWQVTCTSIAQDQTSNIKPVKPDARKTGKRIDGVVALVMAVDRAGRHQPRRGRVAGF